MAIQHLSTETRHFLYKDSTQTFLFFARQFVDLLETKNIDKETFCSKAHTVLIELYATGHKLEQIGLNYSSADSSYDTGKMILNKNAGLISELGTDVFYWEIFDPLYSDQALKPGTDLNNNSKEPALGSLVDDFADIYRDLKTELEKLSMGTDEAVEDALWQMKWGFTHHWGQHCISALRYLHFLEYDGKQAP